MRLNGNKIFSSFLVFLLLVFGVFVALASLYTLSITGAYSKMGLSDKDYSTLVDYGELSRLVSQYPSDDVDCGIRGYAKGVIDYTRSSGLEKGERSIVLGERRVICGVRDVISGRNKWGAYMVVKGVRYLEEGTLLLGESFCEETTYTTIKKSIDRTSWYLGAYLESTEGSIRQAVILPYTSLIKSWREHDCVSTVNGE